MFAFQNAVPVFLKGKSQEINLQAAFQCTFRADEDKTYTLCLTGATLYRVYLNGNVVHYGPARAPHGFVRCDRVLLLPGKGDNVLTIEVAGYNCPSFYTINIPSFVQAELLEDTQVVCFTGRDFQGIDLSKIREKKVLRYSYQRAFTEVWHLENANLNWKLDIYQGEELECLDVPLKRIERGFSLPFMPIYTEVFPIESGSVQSKGPYTGKEKRFTRISEEIIGFTREECPDQILDEMNVVYNAGLNYHNKISAGRYSLFKLGKVATGFIRLSVRVNEPSTIYLAFDEKLTNGVVECGVNTNNALNIVKYTLKPEAPEIELETFECYTFRYLAVIALKGDVTIEGVELRQYVYPVEPLRNPFGNRPVLGTVLDAAFESFRQNTLDCFMDCPGRERAGWLCDSFFTAIGAYTFTRSLDLEKLFLENFLLPDRFPGLPKGLLPMCYPGENIGKVTIMQWTLWFVVELGSYENRGGDVTAFQKLVADILAYFEQFENEDGLLEDLPYWNFVEFSKANSLTAGVNYPTNMLYYKTLQTAYRLYPCLSQTGKCQKIRQAIIDQSFDGYYFRDHALRTETKKLTVAPEKTAICQHEAFFFGVANREDIKFRGLLNFVIDKCGYGGDTGDMEPLSVFIGYNIRVLLLNQLGEYERNLLEIEQVFGKMADESGTLWEHLNPIAMAASMNHGMNSCVASAIMECFDKMYEKHLSNKR